MARPKKAVVDYFPHFVNHGKTMFTLENRYGNDGYAFWFKVLEVIGSSEHHFIDCNNDETWEYLLAKVRLDGEIVNEILDLLAKFNSIDKELWENRIIWSESFITNLSTVYSRRGINLYNKDDIRGLCTQKLPSSEDSANIYPQSKVKESIVTNSNGNDNKNVAIYNKDDLRNFWIEEFSKLINIKNIQSDEFDGKSAKQAFETSYEYMVNKDKPIDKPKAYLKSIIVKNFDKYVKKGFV
jgi:hypothetical protein